MLLRTLKQIEDLIAQVRLILGEDFVSTDLSKRPPVSATNEERFDYESLTHPLASGWQQLNDWLEKKPRLSELRNHPTKLATIDALATIKECAPIAGFERTLIKLKVRNEYHSALFELRTAAQYQACGYGVSFVSETQDKSADLLVRRGEASIWVECKSLKDPAKLDKPVWQSLETSIRSRLYEHQRAWAVHLNCACRLTESICADILTTAEDAIRRGDVRTIHKNGEYEIWFHQICAWDDELIQIEAPLPMKPDEIVTVCQKHGEMLRQPTALSITYFFRSDHNGRIGRALNKANKQVRSSNTACGKTLPGIVHIELNAGDGSRTMDIIESAWGQTRDDLRVSRRDITAVVLNARVFAADLPGGRHTEATIVPNTRSKVAMPKGFRPPGITTSGMLEGNPKTDRGGREGSLLFVFEPKIAPEHHRGLYLINESTADGLHQFRIWTDLTNQTHVCVVTPGLGRISRKFELMTLKAGARHTFSLEWAANDLKMFIDNQELSPTGNARRT